jgi:hypothetical protein
MFDPQIEEPLTLKQAAKLPMLRKNGKPIHVATLFRWTTCGCRGVVLESIQIGGSRCVSRESLLRFFAALTGPKAQAKFTPAWKRKQDEIDARELEEAGI